MGIKPNLYKIEFWANHIKELIIFWSEGNITSSLAKKKFFTQKKYLGSKDKKIIGDSFYFYLRHKLLIDNVLHSDILYFAYEMDSSVSQSVRALLKNIDNDNIFQVSEITKEKLHLLKNSESKNFFPQEFLDRIPIDEVQIQSLCIALNSQATTDIRVIKNRKIIEEELDSLGIGYNYGFLKDCIKLEKNVNFNIMDSYKNGSFEIQDESSQLVSLIVSPKAGESILDYCSGGGGKTLHMAELSSDKASIDATDINLHRLKETERRVNDHKFTSVNLWNIEQLDDSNNTYDKILIDAPCSGSGTVRRAPELRYNINSDLINNYNRLQHSILEKCKAKLKSSGKIFYSTCSLFEDENDKIIENFLAENSNFEVSDIKQTVIDLGLESTMFRFTEYGMMTLTHKTNSDGFYISEIVKK